MCNLEVKEEIGYMFSIIPSRPVSHALLSSSSRGPAADEEAERDESLSRSPSPRRARLPSDDEDEALSGMHGGAAGLEAGSGGCRLPLDDTKEVVLLSFSSVSTHRTSRHALLSPTRPGGGRRGGWMENAARGRGGGGRGRL